MDSLKNYIKRASVFLIKKVFIPILYRKNTVNLMEKDWKNLIILDACRFDLFNEVREKYNLKGELNAEYSNASETQEFLLKNFAQKFYKDIVYITANPFVDRLVRDKFFKVISVWKDGWDDKCKTVLPSVMYEKALKYIRKYPNKRIIIHFIQPHYPYINYDVGDESFEELRDATFESRDQKSLNKVTNDFFKIYTANFYVTMDTNIHWKAYKDNLEQAIPYVKKLLNNLPGKTVVTADHGEAFGEKVHPLIPFKIYGHPIDYKIPVLTKVPWYISNNELNIEKSKIKNIINKTKL